MDKNSIIPSAITTLRLITLPFLLFFLNIGDSTLFFSLFLFSASTDLMDGYVARKLKTTSRKGAYYDSIADFCLIIGVFLIFTAKSVCPYWIPVIIIFSFTLFMITSIHRIQIYDPIGKYFGGFLYVTIAVLTVAPTLNILASLIIAIFFIVSLASRITHLLLLHQGRETGSSRKKTLIFTGNTGCKSRPLYIFSFDKVVSTPFSFPPPRVNFI
jgi:CDP-diacylglycerol--glycerol-3-phosphate 3-phosphatidyltransferase/cardiolipin synthase